MPPPAPINRLNERVDRLPGPIPAIWQRRTAMHERFEQSLTRLQGRHERAIGRLYDTLRTAHWYV